MNGLRLLGMSALVMSSCAIMPSTGPAAEVPADWKNAAGFPVAAPTKDLSRWWAKFDDPVLSRIIADALKQSPTVAEATARVRQSRAQRNAAAANLLPSVSGSAGTGATTSHNDVTGSSYSNNFTAGLDAAWEIDLFGKRRSAVDAAAASLGASEENLHSVQAALASEIAIAYTNLRSTEGQLRVVRDSVKSREETYQLASWKTQAGQSDQLDLKQAESSLEQAKAEIPSLEQSAGQSRNLLAVLAGRPPGELNKVLSGGKGVPVPERSLAVGIPSDTLRQRPDVRVAGYQWLAAVANTKAAKAERYPSLNLSGSLGLNTLSSGKIFDPETSTASLIMGLTGPIFDFGRIRANIESQSAAQEQTLQSYRATVLTALSEVEDALIACRRTEERIAVLDRATAAAREADQLAAQRYEAGTIDFLTVLDSQRTLLGLEQSIIGVRAQKATAYIQLYNALGGGWSAKG
ncbi:MAG: transporter [Akkermansiaceae bacterium]|nr:transporter [Akkermansiaceae bacterium]